MAIDYKDALIDFLFIINSKRDDIKISDKVLKNTISLITDYTLQYYKVNYNNISRPVSIFDFKETVNSLCECDYNSVGIEECFINDDIFVLYNNNKDDIWNSDYYTKYIKDKKNIYNENNIGIIIFDNICKDIKSILKIF